MNMDSDLFLALMSLMQQLGKYKQAHGEADYLDDNTLQDFFNRCSAVLSADTIFRTLFEIVLYRDQLPIRAKDRDEHWKSMWLSTVGEKQTIEWLIEFLQKRLRLIEKGKK